MAKLSVIAKLVAADGKTAELEAAMRAVVDAAEEEAGLEIYSAHAVDGADGEFWFFELYRDADAVDVHGKGERMRAAMGGFAGLLAGRPEIIRMTPVVAKGLEL